MIKKYTANKKNYKILKNYVFDQNLANIIKVQNKPNYIPNTMSIQNLLDNKQRSSLSVQQAFSQSRRTSFRKKIEQHTYIQRKSYRKNPHGSTFLIKKLKQRLLEVSSQNQCLKQQMRKYNIQLSDQNIKYCHLQQTLKKQKQLILYYKSFKQQETNLKIEQLYKNFQLIISDLHNKNETVAKQKQKLEDEIAQLCRQLEMLQKKHHYQCKNKQKQLEEKDNLLFIYRRQIEQVKVSLTKQKQQKQIIEEAYKIERKKITELEKQNKYINEIRQNQANNYWHSLRQIKSLIAIKSNQTQQLSTKIQSISKQIEHLFQSNSKFLTSDCRNNIHLDVLLSQFISNYHEILLENQSYHRILKQKENNNYITKLKEYKIRTQQQLEKEWRQCKWINISQLIETNMKLNKIIYQFIDN